MAACQAALEQPQPLISSANVAAGSMVALAPSWSRSHRFASLAPIPQRTCRRLLEGFLARHGTRPLVGPEPRHLHRVLGERRETPAQANALRTVLRLLLQHAFERGPRKDNPTRNVKRLRYRKKPFATWAESDIAAFEADWPIGSRARLALGLLLFTGQRRAM
jgi:hypothetical protein